MYISTLQQPSDRSQSTKFSELYSRVSLLCEPRYYNYIGVAIERKLTSIVDKGSVDYTELMSIYTIFLQNFSDINEGAAWKSNIALNTSAL